MKNKHSKEWIEVTKTLIKTRQASRSFVARVFKITTREAQSLIKAARDSEDTEGVFVLVSNKHHRQLINIAQKAGRQAKVSIEPSEVLSALIDRGLTDF